MGEVPLMVLSQLNGQINPKKKQVNKTRSIKTKLKHKKKSP